jgi:hypothetical protein
MRRKPHPLRRWLACALLFPLALFAAWVAGSVLYVHLHERATPEDAAPAGGRFSDIEGTEVFARDFGPATGKPLLLVHGTAAWSGTWFSLVPALRSAGWRVVAVDPGRELTATIMGAHMSYAVLPREADVRLVLKVVARTSSWLAPALSVGDLVMARKQLLTLKELAEADQRPAGAT